MRRNLHRRSRSGVLAWTALAVVYVVWGSTYLAIRVGVRDVPPGILAGFRFLIAGALLYPIAAATPRGSDVAPASPHHRPGLREWAACAVVGVLLLVLGNGGVTLAEQTVPSGLAAVLVATVPLWMVLFAVPIERQRVSALAAAALLLGLAGVAVLVGGGPASGHAGGVVIVLAASASWGLGSVLSHRLRLPGRALLAAAIQMLIGGMVLLIVALASGEFAEVRWHSVAPASWLALAWLVVLGSIVAFSAYGYALRHLPLATVSTYAYVNPVVAVLLGTALLHEGFTLREALGAVLVVGSVALTLYYQSARHPEPGASAPAAAEPDTLAAAAAECQRI